jgi:hypothetical protein
MFPVLVVREQCSVDRLLPQKLDANPLELSLLKS